MSAAPTRIKQFGEARILTFDFTSKLASGDTVASVAEVTADTGITVTAPTLSGNKVTVMVSGGVRATGYWISCRVLTTPGAETLELDVSIAVQDHEN